jgi:hypothetical protein
MANVFLEIERLKSSLRSKGLSEDTIQKIAANAEREITKLYDVKMSEAIDQAVQVGVEKDSADFINELRPKPGAFELTTDSGNMDFSTPKYPMLPWLLKNAKPMKDGSGVFKVIPVGAEGKKPSIANNIFDAHKAIAAERAEDAKAQYKKTAPKNSVAFRTATSKQSASDHWVMPAKEKDFTEDLRGINEGLKESLEDAVMQIIRDYEEGF